MKICTFNHFQGFLNCVAYKYTAVILVNIFSNSINFKFKYHNTNTKHLPFF